MLLIRCRRLTTSTWLEEMILMNIVEGVHGKWSTIVCLFVGSGLPEVSCMGELVYGSLPVNENMSTAVRLSEETCPLGLACQWEHVHLVLPVNGNISTDVCLSVETCPLVLACLRKHIKAYSIWQLRRTCRQAGICLFR